MKANNIIINREDALTILNAAEKRCSARTFGDLEAIEDALKDLLESKGYAKTCNSKLKDIRAIVGETTGEYGWNRYSRNVSYPNSNQATFVHLVHNGKGWKLESAERTYTSKHSTIDTSNTKEEIEKREAAEKVEQERLLAIEKATEERRLAIEEAERQLAEYVESRIANLTLADTEGVKRSLEAVVKSVIEKEKGYKVLSVEHIQRAVRRSEKAHSLKVSYRSDKLDGWVSAEVQLTEDNILCENCENCKWCYFCKDCKDCLECVNCIDCSECRDCSDCSACIRSTISRECTDCKNCHVCSVCKECIDCTNCKDCTNCTDCLNCGFAVTFGKIRGCKNCVRCVKTFNSENCTDCVYLFDCSDCTRCGSEKDMEKYKCSLCHRCENCIAMFRCNDCKKCKCCNDCNNCKKCRYCGECNDCTDCYSCKGCNECTSCEGLLNRKDRQNRYDDYEYEKYDVYEYEED